LIYRQAKLFSQVMRTQFKLCLACLLVGLTLPAAAQEQMNGAGAICKSMSPPLVLTITALILALIISVLILLSMRLQHGGWSLANAVSEPTHLSIPLDEHWAQSQGDSEARIKTLAASGPPTAVILMEASTSRLIALAGSVAILLIYVGFGIFSLYTYGLTCQMPASTVAVSTFLYSGLTLFAPYVANKVSGRLPAGRAAPAQEPAPAAQAPLRRPAESPTKPLTVSALKPSTLERPVVKGVGPITPHRLSGPAASHPLLAPATPAPPPYEAALRLIAEFEGFVDHAYPDPASGGEPWTIGYGFTSLDGRPVQPGDTISQAEGDAQLLSGVNGCARHLAGTIPYWISMAAEQQCALISFAWNLGEDFYGSAGFDTISRLLRQKDWSGVPAGLLLYCDPGTAVSDGLRRRRQAEANLWSQGMAGPSAPAAPAAPSAPTVPATPSAAAVATSGRTVAAHANPLNVPWFDQLAMDDGQGWRDCFSASSAMLAAFWGKEPNEDDYNALRQSYGDSTSAEAQLAALRHLGLQAEFCTDGSLQTLKTEIDAGRPVAVGWLHHGPPSAPSGGGHWTVVIGYDDSGVIMNDPYGSCDLVNGGYPQNHNGARQHYSYANWEPRWRPQGSGGWYLVAQR
jgi:GH24 family phage-related lysozyme (muramidase)